MTIPRFLVENYGANVENAKLIFSESLKKAKELGAEALTLVVPAKTNFSNTIFDQVIGEKEIKALCNGKHLTIENVSIELITPSKILHYEKYGVVVGLYLSEADFRGFHNIRFAEAISFLPWSEKEGKKWQSIWIPTVWGKSTWKTKPVQFNPDVEEKLQGLTTVINLSTGLAHPSDKKIAKERVREIKVIDPTLTDEAVLIWAIRNGWSPRHAEELSKLI